MLELYATSACPFCAELRDQLDWDGKAFVEYDVEIDAQAKARLFSLAGSQTVVPVLVEDGRVLQVGWQGRGCAVGPVT